MSNDLSIRRSFEKTHGFKTLKEYVTEYIEKLGIQLEVQLWSYLLDNI